MIDAFRSYCPPAHAQYTSKLKSCGFRTWVKQNAILFPAEEQKSCVSLFNSMSIRIRVQPLFGAPWWGKSAPLLLPPVTTTSWAV